MTVGLRARVVRWPIAGTGAARGRAVRDAVIVELALPSGVTGFGEAAPLPGLSRDQLADVLDELAILGPRLDLDLGSVADLARIGSPALRFALETAWLDASARERGVRGHEDSTVAALLVSRSGTPQDVTIAVVVDDPDDARRARAAGVTRLKIKVGDAGELARVREIAAAVPGLALRLDANRAWPRAEVGARMAAFTGFPIEYVEEPCVDAAALLDDAALPLRIALDESLADLDDAAVAHALRSPRLAAVILKPTLLGGARACLALATRARAAGVASIVSHGLEGPIGTAACAELARATGGEHAVGLAAHPALAAWNVDVVQLRGASVIAAAAPGLGLARDALERALERLADPLSITTAAHDAAEDVAVVTLTASSTWSTCARRSRLVVPARAVIATPTLETLAVIHRALDDRAPLALLHPRATAAEQSRQRALVEAAPLDDAAFVLFTSGSTGTPRGVVLGREGLLAAADMHAAHLGWRADDRWLLALSLAHAGGLAIAVRCLVARRPLELVEDPATLARQLASCTLASLVPTQLAMLLDDPAWRPAPGLRAVLLGGAAAPPSLLAAAAARGVPFVTTYGMTESFGQLATASPARTGDPEAPLVPLPGVTITAGTRAAPAAIRVRAPALALRYLDDPVTSGTAIAPELATADLGFFEGGALYVVGRADDVIISGGENVHPHAVEAVLAATPGVRAACAFGVADERWGQLVGAALAIDDRFDVAAAVERWQHALPPHARPRQLALVGTLPVSPSGKLDRRAAAQIPRTPVRSR